MKCLIFAALLLAIAACASADDELPVLAPQPGGVAPGKLVEVYLKQPSLEANAGRTDRGQASRARKPFAVTAMIQHNSQHDHYEY